MLKVARIAITGLFFIGCGGAMETPSDGLGGASGGGIVAELGGGDANPSDDSLSTSRDKEGAAASLPGKKKRLGTCRQGPRVDDIEDVNKCLWVADNRCYEDLDAACNCTCPLDVAEVTCVAAFPTESGRTDVYCF